MSKLKNKVRALWAGVISLGIVAVVGAVAAYSGSAQNAIEAGNVNIYNSGSPEQMAGIAVEDEMLGAASASDASHLTGKPIPTALGRTYFSADIEVDGVAYLDGQMAVSSSLVSGGLISAKTDVASSSLTAAEVCDYSYITIAPVTTSPSIAFPATSTLFADCLTVNGQYKDITIGAVTTSTVFTAGTGGSLDFSESANVDAGEFGLFRVIRTSDNAYELLLLNANN